MDIFLNEIGTSGMEKAITKLSMLILSNGLNVERWMRVYQKRIEAALDTACCDPDDITLIYESTGHDTTSVLVKMQEI